MDIMRSPNHETVNIVFRSGVKKTLTFSGDGRKVFTSIKAMMMVFDKNRNNWTDDLAVGTHPIHIVPNEISDVSSGSGFPVGEARSLKEAVKEVLVEEDDDDDDDDLPF